MQSKPNSSLYEGNVLTIANKYAELQYALSTSSSHFTVIINQHEESNEAG